jgi:hypothetical protein
LVTSNRSASQSWSFIGHVPSSCAVEGTTNETARV